jgi:hypothetical protein
MKCKLLPFSWACTYEGGVASQRLHTYGWQEWQDNDPRQVQQTWNSNHRWKFTRRCRKKTQINKSPPLTNISLFDGFIARAHSRAIIATSNPTGLWVYDSCRKNRTSMGPRWDARLSDESHFEFVSVRRAKVFWKVVAKKSSTRWKVAYLNKWRKRKSPELGDKPRGRKARIQKFPSR